MKLLNPDTKETESSEPIVTLIAKADKVPWYKKRNLRYLYIMLFPACMGIESTSGFDSQMINALQIVPAWIQSGMYIAARIILGFGIPTCIVSGSSLVGELSYPKERPVLTSFFNVAYFVGQTAAAGITFGTNSIPSNWARRIPSLLQMVPSILQIATIFLLPESPRWLITRDRSEEAFDILVKYHAEGDRDSEIVRAEMAQIQTTINLELKESGKTWLSIFHTAGMRRRAFLSSFLGLFTQWSGNTFISYYLGDLLAMIGHTDSIFKQKINLAIAFWGGICASTAALLVTRFKRRTMCLACTISLLVVYICWTISMQKAITARTTGHNNRAAGIATIFFIFAYSPYYNLGYNALTYTYLVELWPYAERSRGITLFQLFGRMASFFTTFVNPIGLQKVSWKWLITYCCWLAFEVCFVWVLFPETANRTLEELAFLFEDKALADQAVVAVEKVLQQDDTASLAGKPNPVEAGQVELIETISKELSVPKAKV